MRQGHVGKDKLLRKYRPSFPHRSRTQRRAAFRDHFPCLTLLRSRPLLSARRDQRSRETTDVIRTINDLVFGMRMRCRVSSVSSEGVEEAAATTSAASLLCNTLIILLRDRSSSRSFRCQRLTIHSASLSNNTRLAIFLDAVQAIILSLPFRVQAECERSGCECG